MPENKIYILKGETKIMNMNKLIAVNGEAEGILGKFVYYSLSNVLIEKEKFCEIGRMFNLSKVKPARESASDAFRNATSDIYDRVVEKNIGGTEIKKIYCRDNKRVDDDRIYRELVKETLGASTNDYEKLANIYLEKKHEYISYENVGYAGGINVYDYCDRAIELFELYKNCYSRKHVDTVIENLLAQMEAVKISIHGKLYFIPKSQINMVDLMEEYIAEINVHNKNKSDIVVNSMFVVDDEKQRAKMTREFYVNYKRDIETYQERIQHFINSKCTSETIINRWILKIQALEQKKQTYENTLKQELGNLDDEFAILKLQSQELRAQGNNLLQCA